MLSPLPSFPSARPLLLLLLPLGSHLNSVRREAQRRLPRQALDDHAAEDALRQVAGGGAHVYVDGLMRT
eukprot:366119-Chlamydomonas_euryale.AAC.35